MVDAMFNAYNVDKTFGRRIVNRAYDLMARNNETYGEYLDLDFLNVPGRTSEKALEHDVSLSRGDFSEKYNYDCVNAQPSMIEDLISHGDRNGSVSVSDIINYRKHVECDISRKDPKFTFSTSQRVVAAGEAALYFYLFQVNGKVPSSYTRSFFLEERIPYLEGWKKPGNAISLTNLSFMSKLAKLSFYETTRRSNSIASLPEPLYSGWLYKRNITNSRWSKRFFRVDVNCFGYMSDDDSKLLKWFVDTTDIISVSRENKDTDEFSSSPTRYPFSLTMFDNSVFVCAALSQEDRASWIMCLERAKATRWYSQMEKAINVKGRPM
ncbi:hypothetical protein ROZALSC1DRAFT_25824, partial [Rozella allomycis CSF55]